MPIVLLIFIQWIQSNKGKFEKHQWLTVDETPFELL